MLAVEWEGEDEPEDLISTQQLGDDEFATTIQAAVQAQERKSELDEAEIEAYWRTGEPCDKAGAYAIQGIAGKFVSRIEGSYSAVVGLPLLETDLLIKHHLEQLK